MIQLRTSIEYYDNNLKPYHLKLVSARLLVHGDGGAEVAHGLEVLGVVVVSIAEVDPVLALAHLQRLAPLAAAEVRH